MSMSTGSVNTEPPTGTVTARAPWNVSSCTELGRRSPAPASGHGSASVACPIVSGFVPNRLVSRTRARSPPTEVCTTMRIVWSWKPLTDKGSTIGLASGAGAGAAAHVPTHASDTGGLAVLAVATRIVDPIGSNTTRARSNSRLRKTFIVGRLRAVLYPREPGGHLTQ